MEFVVKENGSTTSIHLKGKKIDPEVSSELKGEFLLLCKPKVKELVVNLSEIDFCDSSGLGALLIAERKMREHGGTLRLVGVRKKVMNLIKISQLDRVFNITAEGVKNGK